MMSVVHLSIGPVRSYFKFLFFLENAKFVDTCQKILTKILKDLTTFIIFLKYNY